ncbi:glycolipid 2-alpha-mannosyltransferase [Fusarium flagelliforme]|uniref:Glycolipid 2-alpha-mannosyltransferase n=1 Tax=Fusarium flagelliforme TaxID=2675880 RepID=A0A395N4J5_9HYPO|nr:glycolipid 2-alpha-mannosyltransferase [Fusarium flagelliforme]
MEDLNLPIAVRRSRRSIIKPEPSCDNIPSSPMPAKTPRTISKRKVRFSEPGISSSSSGLTPMVGRFSVATPKRRRHSSAPVETTPSTIRSTPALPQSGDVTFLPLRQVLDGRVQRRIRRNGLSEEMNVIQQEKRRRSIEAKEEIEKLRDQLKARDREIYELQNATIVVDTGRIWDLEKQIEDLQDELSKRSGRSLGEKRGYNWTLSAREKFSPEFMDMVPDEDEFGEETMAQFVCSTPSRARAREGVSTSFIDMTPPATSPTIPGSPLFSAPIMTTTTAGVQACMPDPQQQQLEEEISSLQLEVTKLTDTLESYNALSSRLSDKLSEFKPTVESESTLPHHQLETQIDAMLRTMSDRACALQQLTASITKLGFHGSDASDMVTSLASGFRAARLELEYLTPGEITLPLSSHGAEVLDLMLTRLRDMAKRAKEDEDAIDEYHEIELSLRKQLDARVTVMDGLKAEMTKAEKLMSDKIARIRELEVANTRLKGAVDGYLRDISELESLVERMERDAHDAEDEYSVQLEVKRKVLSRKEDSIAELETRLSEALQRSADLQREVKEAQEAKLRDVAELNKRHGAALAAGDATVIKYRGEIDRVNASLRAAHTTICSLRVENGGLKSQMDEERTKAKAVIDSMKEELQRVVQMSQEFLTPNSKAQTTVICESEPGSGSGSSTKLSVKRPYDSSRRFQSSKKIEEAIPVPSTVAPLPLWQRLGPLTTAAQAYARAQSKNPLRTQVATAIVIYIAADLSAQYVSDNEYDPQRTVRNAIIGGVAAIPNFKWFLFLSHNFNYSSRLLSLATKVAVGQAVFTPIFNTYFFGAQALLSGENLSGTIERVKDTVPTSIVNSCKLWPMVTAFSFSFLSIDWRPLFHGVVAVGWQTYLSFLNRQAEMKERLRHEGKTEEVERVGLVVAQAV